MVRLEFKLQPWDEGSSSVTSDATNKATELHVFGRALPVSSHILEEENQFLVVFPSGQQSAPLQIQDKLLVINIRVLGVHQIRNFLVDMKNESGSTRSEIFLVDPGSLNTQFLNHRIGIRVYR